MAEQVQAFTVEGAGQFPIDMLRYDACWPSTQQDVAAIERIGTRRRIQLRGITAPTAARWKSFGWAVLN